jgi:hypothetical protein
MTPVFTSDLATGLARAARADEANAAIDKAMACGPLLSSRDDAH